MPSGVSQPKSLLLFGAGKMGEAMLNGWISSGLPGRDITIIDPYVSQTIRDLAAAHGFAINPTGHRTPKPEVVVLAIKPQMLDEAAAVLHELVTTETLVISVMAGKTIADTQRRMPLADAVIRAMPNTPAAVGRGITGMAASPSVTEAQKAMATRLLSVVGRVEWLHSEIEIDMVTAVSGSGPAYVFHLVECLAKAGVDAGLDAELAMRLARATVEGAGELLFRDPASAETLRKNVTSPGGTTAAALDVLMAADGLAPLMSKAVNAAKRRAAELSG